MNQAYGEWILDSLLGNLTEAYCCKNVENLFAGDTPCAELYDQMLAAYRRLCSRLGEAEEDADCEIIIDSLLEIMRIVSLKMFDCGTAIGK